MMTRTRPDILSNRRRQAKRRAPFLSGLLTLLSIHRERKALSELDDHLLNDIGLTRNDAERETKRPVWDAPERWFR